jgi:UDP-glucose 4-epimerase
MGRLDGRILCLTNVYGPRMALHLSGQGFLGNFLRLSLAGERIRIFGDGRQLRDPVYIDDVVDAFLRVGQASPQARRLWNVGGASALSLSAIAECVSGACAAPPPIYQPFPPEHRIIDIGSYATDWNRIRTDLGWRPAVPFDEGVRRTIEYYRRELLHYLPDCASAPCRSS